MMQQAGMRRVGMNCGVHPVPNAIPRRRCKAEQERDHHSDNQRHRLLHCRAQTLEVTLLHRIREERQCSERRQGDCGVHEIEPPHFVLVPAGGVIRARDSGDTSAFEGRVPEPFGRDKPVVNLAGARNLHTVRERRDCDHGREDAEERPCDNLLGGAAVAAVGGQRRDQLERHEGACWQNVGELR